MSAIAFQNKTTWQFVQLLVHANNKDSIKFPHFIDFARGNTGQKGGLPSRKTSIAGMVSMSWRHNIFTSRIVWTEIGIYYFKWQIIRYFAAFANYNFYFVICSVDGMVVFPFSRRNAQHLARTFKVNSASNDSSVGGTLLPSDVFRNWRISSSKTRRTPWAFIH